MDVHKYSISIAVLASGAARPKRLERLPNDLAKLKRFLESVGAAGELGACYEASSAQLVHRAMRERTML